MKKLNKYVSLAAVSLMAMGFVTSCDNAKDNDYVDMYDGTTPSVYFQIQSAKDISLGANNTQFSFTVNRDNTSGEQTAQLSWTGADKFNVPSSVTFADGSDVANVVVTYSLDDVEMNYPYEMTCTVVGTEDTEFTQSTLELVVEITPWEDLGQATYYDWFVGPYWAGYSPDPYKVNIQQSLVTPGLYRIEDPYGEAYPWNDPGDWDDTVITYLYINATDPTNVYVSDEDGNADWYESTCDWGAGNFQITTYASYYLMYGMEVPDDLKGTLVDGVIYLGTNSPICYTPYYGSEVESCEGPAAWITLP